MRFLAFAEEVLAFLLVVDLLASVLVNHQTLLHRLNQLRTLIHPIIQRTRRTMQALQKGVVRIIDIQIVS